MEIEIRPRITFLGPKVDILKADSIHMPHEHSPSGDVAVVEIDEVRVLLGFFRDGVLLLAATNTLNLDILEREIPQFALTTAF